MPYSPKLREDLVSRLYKLKHSSTPKTPITKLVNEAVEDYLSKKEVRPDVEQRKNNGN